MKATSMGGVLGQCRAFSVAAPFIVTPAVSLLARSLTHTTSFLAAMRSAGVAASLFATDLESSRWWLAALLACSSPFLRGQ